MLGSNAILFKAELEYRRRGMKVVLMPESRIIHSSHTLTVTRRVTGHTHSSTDNIEQLRRPRGSRRLGLDLVIHYTTS